MAAVAPYLADNSAIARRHLDLVDAALEPLVTRGMVATCGMVELEVRWSARGPAGYAELAALRSTSFEWLDTDDVDLRRALEVQAIIARDGRHRSASLPDLVVAAVAERHRVTVLHYDADYDTIAEVTGQRVEWVVPRGTVP